MKVSNARNMTVRACKLSDRTTHKKSNSCLQVTRPTTHNKSNSCLQIARPNYPQEEQFVLARYPIELSTRLCKDNFHHHEILVRKPSNGQMFSCHLPCPHTIKTKSQLRKYVHISCFVDRQFTRRATINGHSLI